MDGLLFISFVLAAYFFPSLVAGFRNHRNLNSVLALNAFLGWTMIGWVISLVWSLSAQPDEKTDHSESSPTDIENETPLPTIVFPEESTEQDWVTKARQELSATRKK